MAPMVGSPRYLRIDETSFATRGMGITGAESKQRKKEERGGKEGTQ